MKRNVKTCREVSEERHEGGRRIRIVDAGSEVFEVILQRGEVRKSGAAKDCNRVVAHVIATLPEQITGRMELLESLSRTLPSTHPQHTELRVTLNHLHQHLIAQRELILNLEGAQ